MGGWGLIWSIGSVVPDQTPICLLLQGLNLLQGKTSRLIALMLCIVIMEKFYLSDLMNRLITMVFRRLKHPYHWMKFWGTGLYYEYSQ